MGGVLTEKKSLLLFIRSTQALWERAVTALAEEGQAHIPEDVVLGISGGLRSKPRGQADGGNWMGGSLGSGAWWVLGAVERRRAGALYRQPVWATRFCVNSSVQASVADPGVHSPWAGGMETTAPFPSPCRGGG